MRNCNCRWAKLASVPAVLAAGVFLAGCSSRPPIPEREVKSQPVMQGIVEPPPTTTVTISTQSPVVPAAYEEPVPIGPLFKPTPALPITPEIKPYDEWSDHEIAADALGRIGESAVPALRQALSNENPQVRANAAAVLARMGSDAKDAVPDLVRLLDDPDEKVRRAATRTLGRIGPAASEAVPALMQTLLTPDQ